MAEGREDFDQPNHVDLRLDQRSNAPRQARGTPEVHAFAETLEDVIIKTVEAGHMTKDLAALVGKQQAWQTTEEFMATLAQNLKARIG